MEAFRPQVDSKNMTLNLQCHDSHGVVQGDPDKLLQVLSNLLQNAVQYSDPGGKVTISTESLPGGLKVTFANSGADLSEKDLPFIFERFYRGEKSRSRQHGGAGIGLAIVKELIDAHNGTVGAEVGHGETRVWFTLPA